MGKVLENQTGKAVHFISNIPQTDVNFMGSTLLSTRTNLSTLSNCLPSYIEVICVNDCILFFLARVALRLKV